MERKENLLEDVENTLLTLTERFFEQGASISDLKAIAVCSRTPDKKGFIWPTMYSKRYVFFLFAPIFYGIFCLNIQNDIIKNVRGARCWVPNNYLVWEFTRPISNCDYCHNVSAALTLKNLTREEFTPYAYSSGPIVVKNAASHWNASKVFSWRFFKALYDKIEGAYESVEECQFLHFKSNFNTLREVFSMSESRAMYKDGEDPWYVGWKNCHLQILDVMRKYYNIPHFLPEDADIPYTNYVFFGYEEGAVMHLDYISRLMWQGQILGSKTWSIAPTPECNLICKPFTFSVDSGDIVLLDTRIWYHSTYVNNGRFTWTAILAVQIFYYMPMNAGIALSAEQISYKASATLGQYWKDIYRDIV